VAGLYIRVTEIDFLLHHEEAIKTLILRLKRQIEQIKDERKEDYIYDLAVKRKMDGMPRSAKIQDRTAKAVLEKGQALKEQHWAIRELTQEINLLGSIIDQLELAKRLLRSAEQKIIQLRYRHGLTYQEMVTEMKMGKGAIKLSLEQALKRICSLSRIKLDEYKILLFIFERMV